MRAAVFRYGRHSPDREAALHEAPPGTQHDLDVGVLPEAADGESLHGLLSGFEHAELAQGGDQAGEPFEVGRGGPHRIEGPGEERFGEHGGVEPCGEDLKALYGARAHGRPC